MTLNAILPKDRAPNTLSVCMIVKDEENNLEDCLKSIGGFADQIVVVDTGSKDETPHIALKHGAKIIRSDWRNDFSYSRNISLDHATSRWILWLDADDRIPPSEVEKFRQLKKAPTDRAFLMKICNVRPGGFGEQWYQLRMFPNHPQIRFERKIHEQVGFAIKRMQLKPVRAGVRIDHVGYKDHAEAKKKALRNREILLTDVQAYLDDPAYLSALGDSCFITAEFLEAIQWYKKVLQIPDGLQKQRDIFLQCPVSIAICYQRLGDLENAFSWAKKSFLTNPEKIDNLFLGAEIKEKAGESEEAIALYEQVLRSPIVFSSYAMDAEGLRARAMLRLGILNRRLGRREQAEEHFRKCLKAYPSVLNCYSELGELLIEKGEFQKAMELFCRSIELNYRGDIQAHLGIAKILALTGDIVGAENKLAEIKSSFQIKPAEMV